MLTDAKQGGRQLLAAAAYSHHRGPVAGTRAVIAAAGPGFRPGGVDQIPAESGDTRHYERHERGRSRRSRRCSWAPPVAPGSWPRYGGWRPVP